MPRRFETAVYVVAITLMIGGVVILVLLWMAQ